jgi:CheY-like chemotaxis protein
MKATRAAPVAKLVVVIDDDPLVLEATGGLLCSWGCCVVTAESCDEAVVCLAETEAGRRPDLIVCDYQLSRGLTGVDAIERLRSAFGKIPALLISADASCPRCEVGPRAYHLLYKPVTAERFYAALVDACVLRPPASQRDHRREPDGLDVQSARGCLPTALVQK